MRRRVKYKSAEELEIGDVLARTGHVVSWNLESQFGPMARWLGFEGGTSGHAASDQLFKVLSSEIDNRPSNVD